MDTLNSEKIKQAVRERYGAIAVSSPSSCCGDTAQPAKSSSPCCSPKAPPPHDALLNYNAQIGYSADDLSSVPAESNMALGCGNPTAIAGLREGETVLDLGSGGGFDCFLASLQVGATGRVIGVDMTPEMVSKARQSALKGNFENVEFRLGEIEYIPAANNSVDVIISNCVINLSTDKRQVFREAQRVLKQGGRLAIADVVMTAQLPESVMGDLSLYCACTSGALTIDDYTGILQEAGFTDISISPKEESRTFIREWREGMNLDDYLVSAIIEAKKG